MTKLGGLILMLTGFGAAAYVMSQGDSPQGDSSRDRPVVDVTTIPPTVHGDVEPTELTVGKVTVGPHA